MTTLTASSTTLTQILTAVPIPTESNHNISSVATSSVLSVGIRPPNALAPSGHSLSLGKVIGSSVGGLVVFILCVTTFLLLQRRRNAQNKKKHSRLSDDEEYSRRRGMYATLNIF